MDSSVLLAIGVCRRRALRVVLIFLVLREPPATPHDRDRLGDPGGASAYLNRQYTVIAAIGIVIAIVIGSPSAGDGRLYLVGAILSASAAMWDERLRARQPPDRRGGPAARRALAVAFRAAR